jgi:hypothetical protein
MKHERCDACGFDGAQYDDESLLKAIRDLGPAWVGVLSEAGSNLRVWPEPGVWSAIEYAAHSRDITALHVFGVQQALSLEEPAFPEIDSDLVDSVASSYGDADPDEVIADLTVQALRLAQIAGDAGTETWSRGLTIGYNRSDVRRLLEHALHDSLHHVDDVKRGLARLGK